MRLHIGHSILDPGQIPEVKGVTRCYITVKDPRKDKGLIIASDFQLKSMSMAPQRYPRSCTTIKLEKFER